jgi:hypothetical protein
MTEIGELVKYNKKLIGSMLVAIEGQEIGKLSLVTIAETLKSFFSAAAAGSKPLFFCCCCWFKD